MNILMISLDPALLDVTSAAHQRHRAFAALAGNLTILVRIRAGATGIIHDEALTLIPVTAPRAWQMIPRLIAAARRLHDRYDLIVTQDMFLSGVVGALVKRRFAAPLLVQSHTTVFDNPVWIAEKPYQRRALLVLARWVLRAADAVRTVNQHEATALKRRGVLQVHVLPLATASADFVGVPPEHAVAMRAELGLSDSDRVMLWLGHPIAFKRVDLLIPILERAASRFASIVLVIVGADDSTKMRLQTAAHQHGLAHRLILRPPMPSHRVPVLFACADVYALTSSYEGLPRVIFEAGAAGIPAVAFRVPGVDEVIDDGVTGYLVDDGDLEAFAARIVSLLNDPTRAQAMGESARQIVLERYKADAYPAKWVGVWRAVVSAKNPTQRRESAKAQGES